MKAFVLAAGLGTRLRPLTDTTPKCLVEIDGKPSLEWWFSLFRKHGIDQILINVHHLPEQVMDFARANESRYGITCSVVHEEVLLGSAGTLRENFDFVRDEKSFFVIYADNLTNIDLTKLLRFHERAEAVATMALFEMDHPETRGIAELDPFGKILSFEEKPPRPKSSWANGGIYVMSQTVRLSLESAFDIGHDVLPQLVGRMAGMKSSAYLRDIGTPESLAAANTEWRALRGSQPR